MPDMLPLTRVVLGAVLLVGAPIGLVLDLFRNA